MINIIRESQDALLPHLEKGEKNDLELVYKTPNLYDFDEDTRLAFNLEDEDEDLLKEWIGGDGNLKFELLYRATRDGFGAGKFHDMCDDKGPTVCLIKSEKGMVFGGYLDKSWSGVGAW